MSYSSLIQFSTYASPVLFDTIEKINNKEEYTPSDFSESIWTGIKLDFATLFFENNKYIPVSVYSIYKIGKIVSTFFFKKKKRNDFKNDSNTDINKNIL